MRVLLGLTLPALILASSGKQCLQDALSDAKTCAFQTCTAYTDMEVLRAQLALCQGGGGGGGGGGTRKVVLVHRPDESLSFMFGTLVSELAFEELRRETTAAFGHDEGHTYDYTATDVQIAEGVTFDFSITNDEQLANYLTTMDRLGMVGVLVAERVTEGPTQTPTTAPTEPILPNVEFPDRTQFWDVIGVEGYEGGIGTWTSRNSYVPVQDCEGPPGHYAYEGECTLKFEQAWGRMFSTNLDTRVYPWMCMAYFIKPVATSINMLVNVQGWGWRSINFTWGHFEDRSVSYPLIGSFPVVADGNWNYDCVNLAELTENKIIHEMIFHWPTNFDYPAPGAGANEISTFWLDAVSFSDLDPTIEHRGSFLRNPTDQPTSAPTTPTVPLAIWTEGTQFWLINDYEDGVDGWSSRNSVIPVQDCDVDPKYQGRCALKFENGYGWGRMTGNNWDTNAYPWFCTGYKIPAANTGINMLVNVSGWGWRSVQWTWTFWDEGAISYPLIGAFEGIVADDEWRHGCFNMGAIAEGRVIHETIFHWPRNTQTYPYKPWGNGDAAKAFWLDDTTISNEEPTDYHLPEED